jgi:hypothetical protein
MKLEDMIQLLEEKNIKIVVSDREIWHDERTTDYIPPYDHYAIIKENGKWCYVLSKVERVTKPETNILKEFDNEGSAIKYMFLKRLGFYFFKNVVSPQSDLSIEHWNFEIVLNELRKNDVPERYFSCNNKLNTNSIYYYYEDDLLFFGYLGHDGKLLTKSKGFSEIEMNWTINAGFDYAYLIFLLDEYEKEINERGFEIRFNDRDRIGFLGLTLLSD